MASFEDLPHDVLWLIFQETIKSSIISSGFHYFSVFEKNINIYNRFCHTHEYVKQTKTCALINKQSLRLIKKKCKRKDEDHWLFVKGALTTRYLKKNKLNIGRFLVTLELIETSASKWKLTLYSL